MKIANSNKKEAAAKKEAGGDEKLLIFFTWPNKFEEHLRLKSSKYLRTFRLNPKSRRSYKKECR